MAAFITARSGGITNCSRTLFQNTSPSAGPPGASAGAAPMVLAQAGSAKSAAEPPSANSRVNERRETAVWLMAIGILRPVGVTRQRREYNAAEPSRRQDPSR